MNKYLLLQLVQNENDDDQLDIIFFNTQEIYTVDLEASGIQPPKFMSPLDCATVKMVDMGYEIKSYEDATVALFAKALPYNDCNYEINELKKVLKLVDYIVTDDEEEEE